MSVAVLAKWLSLRYALRLVHKSSGPWTLIDREYNYLTVMNNFVGLTFGVEVRKRIAAKEIKISLYVHDKSKSNVYVHVKSRTCYHVLTR